MGLTAHRTSIYLLKAAVIISILILVSSLSKVYKPEHQEYKGYQIKLTQDSLKIIDPKSMNVIYKESFNSNSELANAIICDNE